MNAHISALPADLGPISNLSLNLFSFSRENAISYRNQCKYGWCWQSFSIMVSVYYVLLESKLDFLRSENRVSGEEAKDSVIQVSVASSSWLLLPVGLIGWKEFSCHFGDAPFLSLHAIQARSSSRGTGPWVHRACLMEVAESPPCPWSSPRTAGSTPLWLQGPVRLARKSGVSGIIRPGLCPC